MFAAWFFRFRGSRRTFGPPEDRDADVAMEERLAGLQFVTRDHLGLPSPAGGRVGDVALSIAETALVRMTEHKTVGPKINAIVTCCKLILSMRVGIRPRHRAWIAHLQWRPLFVGCVYTDELRNACKDGSQPGADDLVPMLTYVVIRARPPYLVSNVRYIERYRTASKLRGEGGYYLASLVSTHLGKARATSTLPVY